MKNNTKTSLRGDAIKLTTSKVITMGIAMVSAMLLSRFRTLEEYGTYSQLLMVVNLMTSLFMLGLPKSINYFLARSETAEEKLKFLSTYYIFNTTLGIISGLGLVCATPIIVSYFDNDLIKNFIYFFAVYPWAKIITSSIENVLIVSKKTSTLIIYRVTNSLSLLLIILIVQFFNWGFSTYMFLFVLVESIFAISVYAIVKGISGKLVLVFDKELIKKMLAFSIPIGLASAVGTLNIELDKLMIGYFLGTEQLAIYTNASREIPVTIVATSFTAVLLPQLARLLKRGENTIAINLWGSTSILSYIIISFLATGFFVFAPDVMTLLYSEKYLSGVSVFRVFCLLLLLRFTYFGMILNSKGKTKFIFYSSIIALGLNIIFNYVLFYSIGFIGPAVATVLSQLIINMAQLIYTGKNLKIPIKKVLPWGNLGMITAVNMLLGMLFYYLKIVMSLEKITGEIIESILLGTIWGALYVLIFIKKAKEHWTILK